MSALFPTYKRFDVSVASAKGTTITDVAGKQYLDFGSGISVCNLGHRHPAVQQAVEEQLGKYWHVSNLYDIPLQEKVATLLTDNSVGDRKSTRLNSSHVAISYAVFCLKKKNKT